MRPIIFLFALFSFTFCAFGGYTTPNTGVNWTLDSLVVRSGGTLTGTFPAYTMTDTITISANDRLAIGPGSVITVTQGAGKGFTVFGILRAIGTITDSIIVKGSVDSAGWHRGFRFDDSSVDSLCVVSYCRIMNAVDAIYCFNSNTLITNCLFTRNSTNAVRCFAGSPTIRNCSFIENRQSCITANSNSSPLIENNLFAKNNSRNNGPNNAIAIGGQGANNPIIRNNEIYNQGYFRAGAIGLSTLGSSDVCNPLIEGNYLHDNSFGIATTAFTPGGTIQPIIRYNRIENNRINPDPLVSGSGITMQAGGPSNAPIITGNIIKGNYWGITCVSSSGLTNSPKPNIGNLSNADTSDDGKNVFDNNNNGGTIYQLYNNGTQDLFAQNNYWGSNDSVTVEQWIVHKPDSSVFGRVTYLPFRTLTTVQDNLGRPTISSLYQNYPNPFNPSTTIRFDLTRPEFAELKVFDLLGRELRTLVSSTLTAGIHSVVFEANDLASGVYFYRLSTGEFVSTKKFLFQK
ncbi:MAG: right-handed parallel beta-helix repeat-containing protein [bacterium]